MIPARRRKTFRKGAAATELALLLPVLCLVCLIAVDYARVFYVFASLSDSARAGAYFYATNSSATSTTISQAALADATNIKPTPTVASSTGTDASGNVYVQVVVSTTFSTLTPFPGIPSSVALSRTVSMIRTY